MPLVDVLPHRPFAERGVVVDGRFRWRLGVRPLDLADWFEFGPDAAGWIAEKQQLMAARCDDVFVVRDDIEPESNEIADAVSAHVGSALDPALHPLDAAARLVPDDLVVMVERDGRLVFGGGSVCFPNRWDLRSKLGRTMAEVHDPVADLNEQLQPAIDSFLDRLRPDRSFWRLGWGLIDSHDGFEPPSTGRTVDPASDDVYLRVERETLRRFERTLAVLFTIRTYIIPVARLDRADREAIAAAVGAMDPGVRSYKDLVPTPS
ncbi:MAG: heme-dependent oxidative N-demethylase family protein [Ilumatobacter sp.]|uniref:heme-dependent oxidative N-demethylase family protein n=1 Tax=Ilumatobacter sp. TaxID=1967498 RepID=UPI00391D0D7D